MTTSEGYSDHIEVTKATQIYWYNRIENVRKEIKEFFNCSKSEPHFVLISGCAGSGKSSLLSTRFEEIFLATLEASSWLSDTIPTIKQNHSNHFSKYVKVLYLPQKSIGIATTDSKSIDWWLHQHSCSKTRFQFLARLQKKLAKLIKKVRSRLDKSARETLPDTVWSVPVFKTAISKLGKEDAYDYFEPRSTNKNSIRNLLGVKHDKKNRTRRDRGEAILSYPLLH